MNSRFEEAIAAHRRGDHDAVRRMAEAALAEEGGDPPLLHFLGMAEARAARFATARRLLERAAAAPGGDAAARVSLARLLARTGDMAALAELSPVPDGPLGAEFLALRAEARRASGRAAEAARDLGDLARRRPDDGDLALAAAAALAEAGDHGPAEDLYRARLEREPAQRTALLGLTGLLDSLSRPAELWPLYERARAAGAEPELVALGRAYRDRAEGRFEEALAALEEARGVLPGAAEQHLRAQLADRAGRPRDAYAAFTAMNSADAAAMPGHRQLDAQFAATLEAEIALSRQRPGVPANPPEERSPPLFLLGFPRSGTTLLDTFLMGHPAVELHEERPFLALAAQAAPDDLARVRRGYWDALDAEARRPDALQVDKNPLLTGRARVAHLVFPDARFLLALRHPCDVVLSCFMTRFRPNAGVAAFFTLEGAARSYDLTMRAWSAARERFGLAVHEVRYERLIAEPGEVMEGVAGFAGVTFDPAMLAHQATARRRGFVATPSHAQVVEPLYTRSAGRWRRYREPMRGVLDLLAPWCDHFGYEI